MKLTPPKKTAILIALILAAVGIDQLLKQLVILYLPLRQPTDSILGFRLHHTHNTGAAFSIFREHPNFLAIFVSIVILGCLIYLFADPKRPYPQSVCLALICAGGMGNLVDRLRFGYVLDYIEPVFMRFAIFNFADMILTCAVAVWTFLLFRELLKERRRINRPV
ncbi:MAG: signal peptidase II [Oscillospiraceae bacterium]|nr:signal peptidase II [Oscillospiraceae bacterium]